MRAAEGLLLSTTARAGSYGSAQGTQMDAQEAVAQLKRAQQLGQSLGDAAQAQSAMTLASHAANDKQALQGLIAAIDAKLQGKHATEKKANGREAGDPVEQFAKPYVVLDTPSAATVASPATLAKTRMRWSKSKGSAASYSSRTFGNVTVSEGFKVTTSI